ncbi:amino acid permease-domain-containing protein [Gautieria morchelliformis]|nr:amino acid permease-domain-containing protein [Gautieria morchelliformis]
MSSKQSPVPSVTEKVDDVKRDGDQYLDVFSGDGPGLQRKLKSRHVQMIAIGGVIGTGLFLRTAQTLAQGGPGGLLFGYATFSTVCICVMLALGELVTFLPVPGGHITLAGRFVDPALEFAMGWNYWYFGAISLPAEISAAAVLINFWNDKINSAVWITMCLVVVVIINFTGPRIYGECEFWFASVKVVTIIGLIILGLVIDLGGAPDHDRRGFRYWHNPGPFPQFLGIEGAKGRFLAFWSTLIQAAYSILGTDIVGLATAESRDPTRTIPRAIRGVWVRIVVFYVVGAFILGLICPSNNPSLANANGTAASSAWVIAIKISGIKALPSIINACVLTSAWSAGSSDLYIASRVLFALAKSGKAPRIFAKTNRFGTPWTSLIPCSAMGLLGYMSVSSGASTVFGWFANMTAVAGMLNWVCLCITAIRCVSQGHRCARPPTLHLALPKPPAAVCSVVWALLVHPSHFLRKLASLPPWPMGPFRVHHNLFWGTRFPHNVFRIQMVLQDKDYSIKRNGLGNWRQLGRVTMHGMGKGVK